MYFQDFLHFFYLIRLISNATLVCQPVSRNPLYVTLLSSFADVVGRCCGQVFHQRFNCQVRHRRFLEGPVRTKGCREGSQGKGMKIGRALNFGVSFCEWVSYICKVCKFFTRLYCMPNLYGNIHFILVLAFCKTRTCLKKRKAVTMALPQGRLQFVFITRIVSSVGQFWF